MTQDDIIRMAREAGLTESNHHSKILVRHSNGSWVDVEQVLTRFAALAAAAERKACIDIVANHGGSVEIEAAIRARGQA